MIPLPFHMQEINISAILTIFEVSSVHETLLRTDTLSHFYQASNLGASLGR